MRHQFLLLVCAMPFLAACSFNKKFLYPTPYPANTDTMTLASSTDTLKIAIAPGSAEDETIPFEMGKKLYNKANQPKSFYQIEKCHICGPEYYRDSISYRILNML